MAGVVTARVCVCAPPQLEATALHWASRGGSVEALQLLLDAGAKISQRDKVRGGHAHFLLAVRLE